MLQQDENENEEHDTRELNRTPNGGQELPHELKRVATKFGWPGQHRTPPRRLQGALDTTGVEGRLCGFAHLD